VPHLAERFSLDLPDSFAGTRNWRLLLPGCGCIHPPNRSVARAPAAPIGQRLQHILDLLLQQHDRRHVARVLGALVFNEIAKFVSSLSPTGDCNEIGCCAISKRPGRDPLAAESLPPLLPESAPVRIPGRAASARASFVIVHFRSCTDHNCARAEAARPGYGREPTPEEVAKRFCCQWIASGPF